MAGYFAQAVRGNLSKLASFYQRTQRFWLAGPLALFLSIVIMAAMSLWLPPGNANVNHIAYPILLFPLIWAAAFFYPVIESNLKRASWIMLSLLVLNLGLVIASFFGLLS